MENILQKFAQQSARETGHYVRKLSIGEDDFIPFKVKLDRENSFIKAETIVGKGLYLYAVKHLLTETAKHTYGYHRSVIHATEGISFPTSDDPVICLNYQNHQKYTFNGGLSLKHTKIIMPISPKTLVFTDIGSKRPADFLDNSLQWSNFFRKIIIEHAHRTVFADMPQKGMLAINSRVVSKTLFDEDKKTTSCWHREQMAAENAFNNGV